MTGGDKDRRLTRADHKDGRVVVPCVGGLGREVPALGLRGRGGVSFGGRLGRGGPTLGLGGRCGAPSFGRLGGGVWSSGGEGGPVSPV